MARVLVTEKIAESGLDLLRNAGHEVDVQEGLSPEELLGAIVGAHALIIRSSTQVTAEVLAAGTALQVVGRAGVGLDNVDVKAATARGVMGRLTLRRMAVCSGGSIITMGAARPSNMAIESGSGVRPCAEENVTVSRAASRTSANRDRTQNSP